MIRSNRKEQFHCKKERIWEIITNNQEYNWRSDVSRIELIEENNFVEYAKNGLPTYFRITQKEPYQRYEFDISNQNLKGHWTGILTELETEIVELDFTEEIEVSNFLMKILAKTYLRKQQETYMKDLRKRVENI